jgi:Ser/Thr protein kinase RdoA (MazF antagonist)
MSELRDLDRQDVLTVAEAALAASMGEAVRIRDVETLSDERRRNLILRGNAVRAGAEDRSIIIKATRASNYDPTAETAFEDFGLVKEWAATALLSAQGAARGHGAMLLAADTTSGLLVFEDLGAGLDSLVEPLLHGGPDQAEQALLAYASALGRLHADTAGHISEHDRVLRAGVPTVCRRQPRRQVLLEQLAVKLCKQLGERPPHDELAQIAKKLDQPGVWLGLVHGDPCPDNAILRTDRVHLIDYEFAEPGHVLLDAVYWRIGFPTCWCAGRIPDSIAARAEAAYRAELGTVLGSALSEPTFQSEMAFVAAAWLLRSLAWRLDTGLKDDETWGIASIRSRLLWYLEITITMTEAADVLPDFRSAARAWLLDLRKRWPSTHPLGLYPAFQTEVAALRNPSSDVV